MLTIRNMIVLVAFFSSTHLFAQVGENEEIANANLATADVLLAVPGIDSGLADTIVAGRSYTTAEQLDGVLSQHLDDKQRNGVYRFVFRPINLNTASRQELMLIPDLSRRMAHEFEEYRPYTSIEQFRREIGKYVSAEEVARLEQYVFVPLSLNNASAADLMTIPGMSRKMVLEFDEYRPYESMEQFRREIGKYVGPEELARLESYVTLE